MPDLSPPAAITAARLRLFAPRCDYLILAPHLDRAAKAAGIDTPREVRHWMAQLHHESTGFTVWSENLNWRDPARLDAMFASVRGVDDARRLIAEGPAAIANRIYAGKAGNGDEGSGDGFKFRGRSLIQLTGRANYREASEWAGVDLIAQPQLAATMLTGCTIAAQWWNARGLNAVVAPDAGERQMVNIAAAIAANELDDLRQARGVINGAQNGIEDAEKRLLQAAAIWRD